MIQTNNDNREYLLISVPYSNKNLAPEQTLIPYDQITHFQFGKVWDYETELSTEEDELVIHYGIPAGHQGDNWGVTLRGPYAKKVFDHLTGVNGLGRIYRINE